MRTLPILLRTICFFIFVILVNTCFAGDRYSYESIREEYTDKSQKIDPSFNPDTPLGLDAAIRIALENNPDSRMALARIEQAQAMIDKAEAAFYPSLGLYTEYVQGDAPSAYLFKTIDQRQLKPNTDFNDPGWLQNFETGVQGQVNLFNGGKDFLHHKMAKRELGISHLDRQAVENSLVAAVIKAYYDYLSAEDFIKIAENSLETVASQLRIMKVRYEAGGALKSDILSLEVRMAQAEEDLVRSKNRLRIAVAALASTLGIDPDSQIHIEGSGKKDVDLPANYEDAVIIALERRPELKKVRERVKQSRMGLDSATVDYLPTLHVSGKYYHDDPNMSYDMDRQNWTVGAMLNWYFFTGLSTRSSQRIASAKIKEMLAADRKTALTVRLDVKTAYLRMQEAAARLEVTVKSVDSAEESLELVKKQYEGGSATITRYLEAELARNSAKINSTSAYYDKEKSIADAGRAIGLWAVSAKEKDNGDEDEGDDHEE
jgi:outer membrane protein